MLHISNFDDVACIITGITVTNSAMVNRICKQALIQTDQEVTAHLANAITNASDSAHAHAWEESNYGFAAPETQVDLEYYQDLVSAWSLVASERGIETLDALHFWRSFDPVTGQAICFRSGPARHRAGSFAMQIQRQFDLANQTQDHGDL